jgi:large subunit ribosomal protein L10e
MVCTLVIFVLYLLVFVFVCVRGSSSHTRARARVLPQTGMRGSFGKPESLVARVSIGQILMSVRSKDQYKAGCLEALRRAKFKFPGRQKVLQSRKWGFTKYNREDYLRLKEEGRLTVDGCYVKYDAHRGPLGY